MELRYTRPHRLNALHDELLAAIPALAPAAGPDGQGVAVVTLSGRGDDLRLVVPDGTARAAIDAVIAAHDPQAVDAALATVATQDATARDRLRAAVGDLATAEAALAAGTVATLAGLRPIVLLLVRVQLGQLRLWARRGGS